MGATVPLAVGRQASVLDRPAPSMSRGNRRWAAYAMRLGFDVLSFGLGVELLGRRVRV